jgi:hypothetical protein
MMSLPQNAVVRRINELVKRARAVKVHAYILHYLKKQMPYVLGTVHFECVHLYLPGLLKCRWLHCSSCKVSQLNTRICAAAARVRGTVIVRGTAVTRFCSLPGKSEKQKKLLDRLDREFLACARRYNLPIGDFPNVDLYRKMLREIKDISDFKRLDKNMVYEMDRVLTHDIPLLLQKATARSSKPTRQSATQFGFGPNVGPYGGSAGDRGAVGGNSGVSYGANTRAGYTADTIAQSEATVAANGGECYGSNCYGGNVESNGKHSGGYARYNLFRKSTASTSTRGVAAAEAVAQPLPEYPIPESCPSPQAQ